MMKTIAKYLLFLLFLNCQVAFAQAKIDTLVNNVKSSKGKERIELLNTISSSYAERGKFNDAIKYARQAFDYAEINKDVEGQVDAKNNLANIYVNQYDIKNFNSNIKIALNLARRVNYLKGLALANRIYGVFYSNQSKLDSAELFLDKSISVAKKNEYKLIEALAKISLSIVLVTKGETDSSIIVNDEAIEIFDDLGATYQKAHALLNLGSIHLNITRKYDEALSMILEAREIFENEEDAYKSSYATLLMGMIYEDMNELDEALEYYSSAKTRFEEIPNNVLVSITLNSIGEVYKKKGELNKAVENYEASLKLNERLNRKSGVAVALNNLGEVNISLGHENRALTQFERSLIILEDIGDKQKIAIVLNNIGAIYQKKGEVELSKQKHLEAAKVAQEAKANNELENSYSRLADLYKAEGDYKNAFLYLNKYHAIHDSLITIKYSDEVAIVRSKYEVSTKEKEIEILKKNDEIAQLDLNRQRIITYSTGAVTVLILFLGTIYFRRFTERKKSIQRLRAQNEKINRQKLELEKANSDLNQLNKKLKESEESLQNLNSTKDKLYRIIAHDLKSPFNALLNISEMLASEDEEFTDEEMRTLNNELNIAARNVYYLLENLLNWSQTQLENIEPFFVKVKMSEIIERDIALYQAKLSEKEIVVENSVNPEIVAFGDQDMLEVIFRNLFSNAIKFSPVGGTIKIDAVRKEDSIELFLKDSGIGIPNDKLHSMFDGSADFQRLGTNREKGTGLGLLIVKEFVELNNGQIEVKSKENEGTEFILTLQAPGQ